MLLQSDLAAAPFDDGKARAFRRGEGLRRQVEGAVGGVLGAGLLGLAYGSYLGRQGWIYFLICSVGALISMVGDLAASAIKRDKGIKDYGDLIPGHGGILDRFDSVIFTAPVIYFLSILLIRV